MTAMFYAFHSFVSFYVQLTLVLLKSI